MGETTTTTEGVPTAEELDRREKLVAEALQILRGESVHSEPVPTLDLDYLFRAAGDYDAALVKVARLSEELAYVESDLAVLEAECILDATASGAINGKNARERELQERLTLAHCEDYQDVMHYRDTVRGELARTKAHAEAMRERLHVLRDWLRSEQAGVRL